MSIGIDETWQHRQLLITHRLRQRRSDLGLTQKQVVTRLERHGLSTTNRAVSSLEHGAGLDVAKLPALADALDCTVTYLVGLTDDPHRWEPDQPAVAEPQPTSGAPTPEPPAPAVDPAAAYSRILGADIPDRGPRLALDAQP
jgi:transcriptional regulator with XRE-family HTH domain